MATNDSVQVGTLNKPVDPVCIVSLDANGKPITGFSVEASNSLKATGTNANAEILLSAPGVGKRYVISGVMWSYSDEPTGGRLAILCGAAVVFDIDITSAGAGFFPIERVSAENLDLKVVLYAGGSGVVGKVNVGLVRVG